MSFCESPSSRVVLLVEAPVREHGLATEISQWKSAAGTCRGRGDWCDVVDLSDEAFALTVGDVSGQGTAVWSTMRRIRSWTLKGIRQRRAPADILGSVNAFVDEHFGDTLATAIVAILNRRQRTLTYANAGHPPPLLLTHTTHFVLKHPLGDLALGVVANHRSSDHVVPLESGGLLIAYTSGITARARDLVRAGSRVARRRPRRARKVRARGRTFYRRTRAGRRARYGRCGNSRRSNRTRAIAYGQTPKSG
jgi:hypothetical protein